MKTVRVMAIDYGDARTGVAFSDLLGTLTGDVLTLHEKDRARLLQTLRDLAESRGVTQVVVGCPKNMDGTLGKRAEISRELATELEALLPCPVILWDERRTTLDAQRILHESGRHGRRNRERVDAVAAALILEGYLGSLR